MAVANLRQQVEKEARLDGHYDSKDAGAVECGSNTSASALQTGTTDQHNASDAQSAVFVAESRSPFPCSGATHGELSTRHETTGRHLSPHC